MTKLKGFIADYFETVNPGDTLLTCSLCGTAIVGGRWSMETHLLEVCPRYKATRSEGKRKAKAKTPPAGDDYKWENPAYRDRD